MGGGGGLTICPPPSPTCRNDAQKHKGNGKSCSKAQTCPKRTGKPQNAHRGNSQATSTTPPGRLKGTS